MGMDLQCRMFRIKCLRPNGVLLRTQKFSNVIETDLYMHFHVETQSTCNLDDRVSAHAVDKYRLGTSVPDLRNFIRSIINQRQ